MNVGKCGAFFGIGDFNKKTGVAFIVYNQMKDDKYLTSAVVNSQTGSMVSTKKELIERIQQMQSDVKLFDYKKYTPEKMYKIATQMKASFPETFFIDAYKSLKKMKTCPKTKKRK
jgi:hypothetical protein